MTTYLQLPVRSGSLLRQIRRGLHERAGRLLCALECIALTLITADRMLLRRNGPDDLSNLGRWLARNTSSQFCSCNMPVHLNDSLTSHLPYRSAGGWRCLLCPIWSERPLCGRCDAPLTVSAPDVWRRVCEERYRPWTERGG